MSIGKRLIDLARAELNSLLDKAARADDDEEEYAPRRRYGTSSGEFSSMSDKELEEEIERRRQAREEVERATSRTQRPEPRTAPPPPRRTAAGDQAIRRAYAALEVPPGSDLETVKHSYRRLMRKYHPDLNTGSKEKQRAATDLSQRLTEAYKTLETHLRR